MSNMWIAIKLLACYLFPFVPICPSIGKLEDGDCIFVQSFGRSSISDRNLGKALLVLRQRAKDYSTHGDEDEFVFRQLKARNFDPGESNYALAYRVMALWSRKILPAMIQWEVAYAIWEANPKCYADFRERIHCLWPLANGYYSTWKVGIDSCIIMEAWRLCRPIEICHPAMKARAVAILWGLGVGVIVEGENPLKLPGNRLWIWDKKSVQFWTRKFWSLRHPRDCWLARETAVRYAHHPLRRLVSFVPPQ